MLGWNSAEIPGIAFMMGRPYTTEKFYRACEKEYPNDADKVLALYPHVPQKRSRVIQRHGWHLTVLSLYSTWEMVLVARNNSSQPLFV